MALNLGTLLAGRYEITAPIAVGGMGEVWRARDRVLDRTVAAKVLRSEYTGDPNFLARFRNEARHTAALTHPNIASVYDYGETVDERSGQNLAFLVMEFVDGQPLVTILHEEGRLPVDWTLHVLVQAADGLSAAHRAGVVHRDIKPGNLMVRPDGVVKLTDFGIAQARDAAPLTRTGMVVGTAQYLSPEQAQGFEVTAASDVYSLGVVAYECLTGVRPFDGTSQVAIALAHINRPPPPLPGDIPPAVRSLVERALAKDPAARFADGGAFAEAVREVVTGTAAAAAGPATSGGTATEVIAVPEGATTVLDGAATGATAVVAAGTSPRTMPPLQARPADEDDDRAGYWDDAEPRRRRWAWVVAALVAVLLLAGGTYFLLNNDASSGSGTAGTQATPTTTGSAPTSAGTVLVDTNSYLGKDADEVTATLQQAGLTVDRATASADQLAAAAARTGTLAAGTVAGTDPANQPVPLGSAVTLFVASTGFTPDSGQTSASSSSASNSSAPQTTASATEQTRTSTSSAAPQTTRRTRTQPQPEDQPQEETPSRQSRSSSSASDTAGGEPAPGPDTQAPDAGAAQDGGAPNAAEPAVLTP